MKKPETLAKIAIGISIVALVVAAACAICCGSHRAPRGFHGGFHGGISQQHEDFRKGGENDFRGDEFHDKQRGEYKKMRGEKPGKRKGDFRKGHGPDEVPAAILPGSDEDRPAPKPGQKQ